MAERVRVSAADDDGPETRQGTTAWKRLHQPWAIKDAEQKLAAWRAVLACDVEDVLLRARGTREYMAQGPEYGRMLSELKTDMFALERAILGGRPFAMQAFA